MPVSSGVRPYRYVGYDPFSSSGVYKIGFSGILFEQAMFGLIAESELYQSGVPYTFTLYKNKSAAISSTFVPRTDGASLARIANPLFKNYILDMRTRFSGLFNYITLDSPYNAQELLLDYFQRHTGNNPSGSVGNWLHTQGELGSSGLYDIDLREVMYQPYNRIAQYKLSTTSGISLPVSPVGPSFCTRTGKIVRVTSRDVANAAQKDNHVMFAYGIASNNKIKIEGDIFSAGSKAYLTWTSGQLHGSATGSCAQMAERILETSTNDGVLNSGMGLFTIPNLGSIDTGIYSIQTFNTNARIDGYYCPTSGAIGFWPRQDELISSGYRRATQANGVNEVFTSGFHIFDAGFFQYVPSGALLISPINGQVLWYRFADNQSFSTANYGPKRWLDLGGSPATPIIGNNTDLLFYVGITADLNPDIVIADRKFVFAKWDSLTLDFLNAYEETGYMPSPESPPSVDRFFYIYGHNPPSGLSFDDKYCISEVAGLSSGPEVYILNTSLENIGAWDTATNAGGSPIGMVNGHLYGFDPTQTSSSGATFRWQHTVFADPYSLYPADMSTPFVVGIIDTAVHIYEERDTVYDNTNGIAALFEPLNYNNFTFGGIPLIIDPRGTALDYGDGSVFVRFNAKMKGETALKSFIGRMNEGSIGGNSVMIISEFISMPNGAVNWAYAISS